MDRRRFLKLVGAATFALAAQPTAAPAAKPAALTAGPAPAWTPKREITFIVPMAPGGSQDPLGRILCAESEPMLKQKLVVVNKAGASSTVGTAEVTRAKPDGYKIGLSAYHVLSFYPLVSKLPFQTTKDYSPIIKLTEIPCVLAVRPDAPWKTIKEFVEDLQKSPGKVRVSVSGRYSGSDLALYEFQMVTKTKVTTVPVASGGEALARVMGGHVEVAASTPVNIAPQVRGGKLRGLAIFSTKRHFLLPDTESTGEAGYDVSMPTVFCVVGPKGLDKAIVDTYYQTFLTVLKSDKFNKFAENNGYTVSPLSPGELGEEIEEWRKKYKRIIEEMKIESVTL